MGETLTRRGLWQQIWGDDRASRDESAVASSVPGDGQQQTGQAEEAAAQPAMVDYSMSGGFVERLAGLGVSLAITSYQSGLFYLLGRNPQTGGLNVHQTPIARPMGMTHTGEGEIVLAAGFHLLRFANALEPGQFANELFDACFVPRTAHVTGHLDAHDIGIDAEGKPVFVNTRYNCLATTHSRHSFEPLWRPSFISDLVDEDRCHLNGLAMGEDGAPAFVTAISRSDTIDGWRDRRGDGGVVVDVKANEVICDGLSMPHSPRLREGKLWLLSSGTGELGVLRPIANGTRADGKCTFEPIVFCPGFLRGLAFAGQYAFVGLSKPRYERFEGLALDRRLKTADSEPWCGVQIIDLAAKTCVDWFRIDGDVAELYDLALLPGISCAMATNLLAPETANFITWPGKDGVKDDAQTGAATGNEEQQQSSPLPKLAGRKTSATNLTLAKTA